MTVWQRFNTWRRSRPFWGGLLTVLAGVEIIATTKMTLAGATLSVGITGLQSILIPFMLVVAGLLAWFTPAQRMFYGLVASFVAIYALLAVNLGGWFVGTLLGIAGGGLIFAWNPTAPAGDAAEDEPDAGADGDQQADMDGLLDGPMNDTPPPAVNPLRTGTFDANTPPWDRHEDEQRGNGPRHAAMVIAVATLATSALSLVVAQQPARAADCEVRPAATVGPVREVIGDIVDTLGGLLGVNASPSPSPEPSPSPCPPAEPTPSPTDGPEPSPSAKPSTSPTAEPTGSASPTASASPEAPGSPTPPPPPILKAAKGQTPVAERPARMTGTRVSMEWLTFDGIVDLPTKDGGTIKCLRFSMKKSDTQNFKLHVFDNMAGKDTEITSSTLTVEGEGDRVLFYTSRFRGKALGLLDVDYTPAAPPLLTPPAVFFLNPIIDLVFVDAPELRAPNMQIYHVPAEA